MELLTNNVNVHISQLFSALDQYGIESILVGDTETKCVFSAVLTGQDLIDAQAVMDTHAPDESLIFVENTVRENREFAIDLIQKLKTKNLLDGLSDLDQAAWVHHRLRKVDYVVTDNSVSPAETYTCQIDVMNLVVSGDIETADVVLAGLVPDDMTKSYHWLSQSLIDWIRNEIRSFLGWPLI